MNPEITDKLNALLDYVGSRAQSGESFVLEQAPLVANEIVAWVFWVNVMRISVAMFVVLVGLTVSIKCLMADKRIMKAITSEGKGLKSNPYEQDRAWLFIAAGMFAFLCILPSIEICYSGSKLIKATVAPRLVIIDYVRGK